MIQVAAWSTLCLKPAHAASCQPCTPIAPLQGDSQVTVGWLESQGIDLSGLVQLGGHTRKRTHTSTRGPVGFSIMKALLDQEAADDRIQVITGAKVGALAGVWQARGGLCWGAACSWGRNEHAIVDIKCIHRLLILPPCGQPPAAKPLQVERLMHEDSRVEGVEYTAQDGSRQRLGASAVILATGGFGASTALLQKYAPEVGGGVGGGGGWGVFE